MAKKISRKNNLINQVRLLRNELKQCKATIANQKEKIIGMDERISRISFLGSMTDDHVATVERRFNDYREAANRQSDSFSERLAAIESQQKAMYAKATAKKGGFFNWLFGRLK